MFSVSVVKEPYSYSVGLAMAVMCMLSNEGCKQRLTCVGDGCAVSSQGIREAEVNPKILTLLQ
jgi:hypothetical protein